MYPVVSCLLLSLCVSVGHLSETICHVGNSLQKLFLFRHSNDFRNFKVVNSSVILECVRDEYLAGGKALISIGIRDNKAFCVEQGSVDGFTFTSIVNWPKKLAGACEDHRCAPGYTCVPLGRGRTCRQLGKPEAMSCPPSKHKESCDASDKRGSIRESYDCTLNTTVQYTRIVATSPAGRLHIFNHSIQKFEAFNKKVNKHSEYVVDFNRCQVIYVFKQNLVTLGLNTNQFKQKKMNANMRLLKFFQPKNELAFIKRDGVKESLCVYKSDFTLIYERKYVFNNIVDISFSTGGESVFILERDTKGCLLKWVNQTHPVKILSSSLSQGHVLMHGLGRVARWVSSSHTLLIKDVGGNDTRHFLTQDVVEIHAPVQGSTYLVDSRRGMYAYDSDMRLIWKTSLSQLYGQQKGAFVRFYFE